MQKFVAGGVLVALILGSPPVSAKRHLMPVCYLNLLPAQPRMAVPLSDH